MIVVPPVSRASMLVADSPGRSNEQSHLARPSPGCDRRTSGSFRWVAQPGHSLGHSACHSTAGLERTGWTTPLT